MEADKLQIISDVYDACYGKISFSDAGSDLAYVTKAIISGLKCELSPVCEFIRLIQASLPRHAVWNYIHLEPTVICINCETEVLWDHARYCPPLNGWLGHNCCIDASDIDGYYEEVVVSYT